MLKKYEIREGNGNDGTWKVGEVQANDAFRALRLASRRKMIYKPRDVRLSDFAGDSEHCYAISYVSPIFGDACRWCAEAHLMEETA
jgi:hypothetical protein